MNDSILNAAEQLLTNDPDVVVPINKLWKLAHEAVTDRDSLTLPEFTDALAHDDRFELISGEWSDTTSGINAPIESVAAPEAAKTFEYDGSSHVKLKRIQITPALLAGIMSKKIETTLDALTRAWDLRPEGDTEAENQLLQILTEVKKLQHDLQALLAEETFREGETKNDE